MGRHATVAGRQAASANFRSRAFTKVTRELQVAAKLGGSDPNANPRLRVAMDKAREVNMPKDTVERAIKKGAGELEGMSFTDATYEGYGPAGIAVMIEVLTDNKNRTNPELKRIFQKAACSLAEQGAVGWMFKRKGVVHINNAGTSEDKIMETALDAGADDVITEGEITMVFCEATSFSSLREALEKATLKIEKSGIELVPDNLVEVKGDDIKTVETFLNALEDHDDVQNVYHNANFLE